MSLDGTWKVTLNGPMGAMPTTLVVKSDGAAFTGTQSAMGQTSVVSDGKVVGEQITWSMEVTSPMKMKLEYAGVLNGREMSGKAKAGVMGSFAFKGVREG